MNSKYTILTNNEIRSMLKFSVEHSNGNVALIIYPNSIGDSHFIMTQDDLQVCHKNEELITTMRHDITDYEAF